MTAYDAQRRRWAATGYQPPTGPGRCPACGWHTTTMSHPDGCPNTNKKEHP